MAQKFPIKRKLRASRPKKYGKVRPVKPTKPEPRFQKPSTIDLRSIYAELRKSAGWQVNDLLAEAVQWYRRMMAYLYAESDNTKPIKKIEAALTYYPSLVKLGIERDKRLKAASEAKSSEHRQAYLVAAIVLYEQEVRKLKVKTPLLKDSLKKAKTSAKKLDKRRAIVERKFDSTLTMLGAAINLGVDLGAVPAIAGGVDFHYDSTLNKMLYSRAALISLKKRIRSEGLLPVALEQVVYIARAAAMKEEAKKTGRYMVDGHAWANAIARGFKSLCHWLANNPDAPNKLIKRIVPRKKRSKKLPKPFPVDHTDSVILS